VAIQPKTCGIPDYDPDWIAASAFQAFLAMTLSLLLALSGLPCDDRDAAGGVRVSGSRGMFILFSREGLDKVTPRGQPHQKP
jgi:hypothetical protein